VNTLDARTTVLEPPTCDDRAIWDLWLSRLELPAVTVADEVGLFTLLAEGETTAPEAAGRLSLGARGAEALLAVTAALGLAGQRGGRFGLAEPARQFLLPGGDFYWGAMLQRSQHSTLHQELLEALRRDAHPEQAPDARLAAGWASGQIDAAQARSTTAAMHAHSFPAAVGVARNGDFTGVTRLLDVAGGSGCFSIALAQRRKDVRCTVMELPEVGRVAEEYIARYGVTAQVETRAANMFADRWPAGHDAVFFSNIFHDWDVARCRHLVTRSFAALPSGGRIYLHEILLADSRDGPLPAALFSLAMLIANYGKQFTFGELESLLSEGGFRDVRSALTYGYYSLVSARKP
jgi:O-methyltransferase domain